VYSIICWGWRARWDWLGMNAIPASGMAISHFMSSVGESLDGEEELSQTSMFDQIPPQPYQTRPFHHMLVSKDTS